MDIIPTVKSEEVFKDDIRFNPEGIIYRYLDTRLKRGKIKKFFKSLKKCFVENFPLFAVIIGIVVVAIGMPILATIVFK